MQEFVYPPKPRPGDRVAVLSPSSGLPGMFPHVFEQGLRRLRERFGLIPVEYPTTRQMNAPPEQRARDIHAAFADPTIKAIIASIGGEDQITVLKFLDADLLRANPKPFFGYSDNTNLHLYLWNLGIVSYYGGSVMVQLGRGGAMHPYTETWLRQALFEPAEVELTPAPDWSDEYVDWSFPDALERAPEMFPGEGWRWYGDERVIEGKTWGGCLEIVDWNLRAGRYVQPNEAYAGCVLYLETSEEMPSATYVYRVLMAMGERGLLQQFPAVLVARPQAWTTEQPLSADEKKAFIAAQEAAIRQALAEYNPAALSVFGLDFGHTDPQCLIPNGGQVRVDGRARKIFVTY